jgi:hypothetical protein
MLNCEIRAEPGQLIVDIRPQIRFRSVLLYMAGGAVLAAELAVTYPHHWDDVARYGAEWRGGTGGWWLWFGFSVASLVWLFMSLVAHPEWFWLGREQVRFAPDALIHRRQIWRWSRTDKYEMQNIKWPYFVRGEGISFAYADRTIRIGAGMAPSDAEELVDALLRQFPQLAPAWSRCVPAPLEPGPLSLTGM